MPHAPGPSEPPIASPSSLCRAWPFAARPVGGWWRFSLQLGFAGVFCRFCPPCPFVPLAGNCFARGSRRAEAWFLNHPSLGPMVKDWRANRRRPCA